VSLRFKRKEPSPFLKDSSRLLPGPCKGTGRKRTTAGDGRVCNHTVKRRRSSNSQSNWKQKAKQCCPYAMRARLALLSSGIRCEIREIALSQKPESMLAVSPKGTVPVLVLKWP